MSISFHNYGFSKDNIAIINALAVRVQAIDATVSAMPIDGLRGVNRFSVAACDKIAGAVATADGKTPSVIYGTHWHTGKDVAAAWVALEARVTALGK